ncbi:glycosyltransferase [Kluyvera cryocrescens]|uniref:glycosyltransferase n=1 Tax=Kluyvera cryocrescens TaxID=580 RepID=UPI002DB6B4EA|nr:glycosyltransferase [Kluyvera cryocrescens]MEB7713071.1 glycosyltransferase [Kluyvera cryocrescens]
MIKFSVLMSVYSKENFEYFDLALKSLSFQTIPADEIVLVVDGAVPQEIYNVIEKWRAILPIKTVCLPVNVGLGNALNIGLYNTTHDLIARMDSDDICVYDRFEKQLKYFALFPETDLLGGAISEFEIEPDDIERKRFSCAEHENIIEYSIKRNPFNHMTMFFKKDCVIQAGGYHHHLFMEDYNLWLRCIANGAICHNLCDVLVNARIGSGMLSRRKGISYINSEFKLLNLKKNVFPNKKVIVISVSLLRVLTRLLPMAFLASIYKKMRS